MKFFRFLISASLAIPAFARPTAVAKPEVDSESSNLIKRARMTLPSTCFHTFPDGRTVDFRQNLVVALQGVGEIGTAVGVSQPDMPQFGNWFGLWLDNGLFPMFQRMVLAAAGNDIRLLQIKFDCNTLPAECNTLREPFGKRIFVSSAATNTIFACPGFFEPDTFYQNKLFRTSNDNSFRDLCDRNDPNFSAAGPDPRPIGQFEWLSSVLLREMTHMNVVFDIAGEVPSPNRHREVERYGIAANHIFWQQKCNLPIPAASRPGKI